MKIEPTKQWLKENRHTKRCFLEESKGYEVTKLDCPDCEFEIKDCHIAFSRRDKYNCGWCVGINLSKHNLDKVRLCLAFPAGKEDWSGDIKITPYDMTVDEVLGLSIALNLAARDYIRLDPEYRKGKGQMLNIKARAVNRKGNK